MVNIEEIDFSAGASGAQKEAVPAPRQAPPTKEEIIRRSARRLVAAQEKAQMDLKERFRKLMGALLRRVARHRLASACANVEDI